MSTKGEGRSIIGFVSIESKEHHFVVVTRCPYKYDSLSDESIIRAPSANLNVKVAPTISHL